MTSTLTEVNIRSTTARDRLRQLGVLPPTVILLVAAVLFVPNFTDQGNLNELLITMTLVGFVAVGMTFVVASGNFVDLSVVAQLALASVCVIALQDQGLFVALLASAAACLAFGAVNGFAIAVLKGNAVVVTLATTTVGAGVLALTTESKLYVGSSEALRFLGTGRLSFVPVGFLLLVTVMLLTHGILTFTRLGHHVKFVGASPQFAQVAGIAVKRTVFACFAAASLGAWAAGVLLAGYTNSAVATVGRGYEFDALAAVVIGGNSLFGGRVSMVRTAVGLVLVSLISNVLLLIGVPYEVQVLSKGLVVLIAVTSDAIVHRAGTRGRR